MFKFRYVDLRKSPKGDYLIIGSLVDRAFRNIVAQWPDSIENSDFSILLNNIISEENSKTPDFPFAFKFQNDADDAVTICRKCVKLYYGGIKAKKFTMPDPTPIDLGIKYLPGTDDHFVQGYVDASNIKENVILEYKTAAKAWSDSQVYEHFQPDLYGWMRGTKPKYEILIFTKEAKEPRKTKKPEGSKLQVIQRPHDPRRERWMLSLYTRLVRLYDLMIGTNLWFPRNNWKCGSCNFKSECRGAKWGQSEFDYIDEKSEGFLTTMEEAQLAEMDDGSPDDCNCSNLDLIQSQSEAPKQEENKIVPNLFQSEAVQDFTRKESYLQFVYKPNLQLDLMIKGEEKKKLLFGGF